MRDFAKLTPEHLRVMGAVGGNAAIVYAAYLLHASDDGKAWPSRATISEVTGLGIRAVERATRDLRKALVLTEDGTEFRGTKRYSVTPSKLTVVKPPPSEMTAVKTDGSQTPPPSKLSGDPRQNCRVTPVKTDASPPSKVTTNKSSEESIEESKEKSSNTPEDPSILKAKTTHEQAQALLIAETDSPTLPPPEAPTLPGIAPPPEKRTKPDASPDVCRLYELWWRAVGQPRTRFEAWAPLLAKFVAKYGAEDVEAALREATTDRWWRGETGSTDPSNPPMRRLSAILRHERFPALPEAWRVRVADSERPMRIPPAEEPAPADVEPERPKFDPNAIVDVHGTHFVAIGLARRGIRSTLFPTPEAMKKALDDEAELEARKAQRAAS